MDGATSFAFVAAPDDPLAAEHADVQQWITDARAGLGEHDWYKQVELKEHASGRKLLDADPEQARRYVIAALTQTRYWDAQATRIRELGRTEMQRANPHFNPLWAGVWQPRQRAVEVLVALMRRALPFSEADLIAMAEWVTSETHVSAYTVPLGALTRAIERFWALHPSGEQLRSALRAMAKAMRASPDKDARRCATTVEQVCAEAPAEAPNGVPAKPPASPAPAGHPKVLTKLKHKLGMMPAEDVATSVSLIGPDQFPLAADSPLGVEHALLSTLLTELLSGRGHYGSPDLASVESGRQVLEMKPAERGRLLAAVTERVVAAIGARVDYNDRLSWQSQGAVAALIPILAGQACTFDRAAQFDLIVFASTASHHGRSSLLKLVEREVEALAAQASADPPIAFSEGERFVLSLLRTSLIKGPPLGMPADDVLYLNGLIGDGATFYLVPSEAWSALINKEIGAMPGERRDAWVALLRHCLGATSARPSNKWLKTAEGLVKTIGRSRVRKSLDGWFAQVPSGRTSISLPAYHGDTRSTGDLIQDENAIILRGLVWLAPALDGGDEMTRRVADVAHSTYRKVPGVGPRAVKVANAAVYALSQMSSPTAVGQLAMLKVRVKFGTAQKEIEKAFNTAAEALGLPRDQIEEMGVPTYGLEDVGVRREVFDDVSAELRVEGRDVSIIWTDANGKTLKSVPAKVKKDHKQELKELQSAAKDIAGMLPAQSQRIDALFLQQKRWTVRDWRERYLDHPLLGTLARRLIWTIGDGQNQTTVSWLDGQLVNVDSEPIQPVDDALVQLWHPIGLPMDDVLSWRAWVERHQVRQPFKQAHREVYLLTDAERRTNTYSNRFAAHVLRQHQFNALCAARGWKSKLRLMVDDAYPPPSRELPQWALRAEFWIESIGDDYGADTNESGVFLRVATDQVRFYRSGAAQNYAHASGGGYTVAAHGPGEQNINEPLPLEQIPPLVLSEVLRDVDLFVGVASVGNDPTWQDGGPGGRYRTYWQNFSFGELSETAQTRKAVLQTLLPRLSKIRDRCTLTDKFLVVRGTLRTYKIHLGSGNILMEPNDQYLCIVADRSSGKGSSEVLLPFEGDATLSIILSKAFLLAEDTKISDATITRQIRA